MRQTPVAAVLLLAAAAGWAVEQDTARSRRPLHVVLFILDDTRWDAIGAAGNAVVRTPCIDQLASEGVRREQARVTTPICMVSRATLLTGQYMSRHGITAFGTPRQSDFDVLRAYEGTHWLADPDGGRIHVTEQNVRDAITFLQARPHGRSPGPQPRRGANSSLGLHAQQAAEQVGIRLTNESAGVSGSDHAPLLLAGIPVLWIGAALSDDWMSTRYHSPKDDMSQPLDFGAASDHSRRVFAVTFLTAQAPERPTWNRGEFFQTFRR